MRRSRRILIGFAAVSIAALASACGDAGPREVSLLRLVVDPPEFRGERVVVRGFLGADLALYASSEGARMLDRSSALQVQEPASDGELGSRCSERGVEIDARFELRRGSPRRSADPRDYELREVSRVSILSEDGRHEACWAGSS